MVMRPIRHDVCNCLWNNITIYLIIDDQQMELRLYSYSVFINLVSITVQCNASLLLLLLRAKAMAVVSAVLPDPGIPTCNEKWFAYWMEINIKHKYYRQSKFMDNKCCASILVLYSVSFCYVTHLNIIAVAQTWQINKKIYFRPYRPTTRTTTAYCTPHVM